MADETFVQSVKIEGLAELAAALEKIGEVGKLAFEKIGEGAGATVKPLNAAEKAAKAAADQIAEIEKSAFTFGASLRNVGSSVSNVVDAMDNMIKRTGVLAAAVTGAATAFGVFLTRTIDSIDKIQEQADALGLSTKAFQEYQAAAIAGGATARQFSSGFQNVNRLITDGIREQDQALLGLKGRIEKTQKSFAGVIRIPPGLSRDVAKENELIEKEVANIAAKLQEPAFAVRNALREMAAGSTESRKQLEKFGITLPSLTPQLDKLRASAEKGGNALTRLGIPLRDKVTGEARRFEEVIGDIADRLSKIDNPVERATTAMQIFGRQGAVLANTFGKGAEETKKFIQAARDMGLILDDSVINSASAASSKLDLLGLALNSVKNRFAAAFAAPLTAGAAGLTKLISENQAALEKLGQRVADFVTPALNDLLLILAGKRGEVADTSWVKNFVIGLETLYNVVKNKLITAFRILKATADGVAAAINAVFGKDTVSGGAILAFTAITALTGGFRLLFAALTLGFRLFQSASAAFRTLALAAGTGGAAGAIALLAAQFARFFIPAALLVGLVTLNTHFDTIVKKANEVAQAIRDLFGGNVNLSGVQVVTAAMLGIAAALAVIASRSAVARAALLALIPPPLLVALGVLAALFGDVTKAMMSAEEVADRKTITEAFVKGRISAEQYKKALDDIEKKYSSAGTAAQQSAEKQGDAAKSVAQEWQEAAAGTGASLNKIDAKNKETSEKVKQEWVKTSANTWELVTKAGTKSADDISKKLQQVGPGTYKVLETEGTKAFQNVGKAADDSAKKVAAPKEGIDQLLERLRKTESEGVPAVTKLSEVFSGLLATAMKNADDNLKAIEERINRIVEKLPSLSQPLQKDPVLTDTGTEFGGRARVGAGEEQDTPDTAAAAAGMTALEAAIELARAALERLRAVLDAVSAGLSALAGGLTGVVQPTQTLTDEVGKAGAALDSGRGQIAAFGEALAALGSQATFANLTAAVAAAVDAMVAKFQEMITAVETAATSMAASVSSALDQVIAKLDVAIAKARELAAASSGGGGGGGGDGTVTAATGGLIHGRRGVDKIPAMVSHGEWIINPKSSARYHEILRAINAGTFKLPKFNMGGLVSGALHSLTPPSPRLAFAGGGLADDSGPMTRIELALPGGKVFQLQGRRNAVNEINDEALRRKAASAGRRPRGG